MKDIDSHDLSPSDERQESAVTRRPAQARPPVVMVVDDDRDTADMYSLALRLAGFKTVGLTDVSSVLVAIDEEVPDVVVLDYHLGGVISGVDLLENLRLDPRTSDVIAFMLSNHPGDADGQLERAFSAGALAWLPKVRTDPGQLAVHVVRALESRGRSATG